MNAPTYSVKYNVGLFPPAVLDEWDNVLVMQRFRVAPKKVHVYTEKIQVTRGIFHSKAV